MGANQLQWIECKDCRRPFLYDAMAQADDLKFGRTPPERCREHRSLHAQEYRTLSLSHIAVTKLRDTGSGGLAEFDRNRAPKRTIPDFAERAQGRFPIEDIIPKLLDNLKNGSKRVHIVIGPTGSGKSTWLPYRLMTDPDVIRRGQICVTEPRIPATEGPARFVGRLFYQTDIQENGKPADEFEVCGPGLAVGYRHSEAKDNSDDHNRLIYCTDGTLLNVICRGELGRFGVVMVDEAHELSENIVLTLAMLRDELLRHPHLHVIVASATIGEQTFIGHFGSENVEVYHGTGRTYPVLDIYSNETVEHWPFEDWQAVRGRWRKLAEDITAECRLTPDPCYVPEARVPGESLHALRYYPQFESLVYEGELKNLDGWCGIIAGDSWRAAVTRLAGRSRRRRNLGKRRLQSITKPVLDYSCFRKKIHGEVLQGKDDESFPVFDAMAEVVRELVLRDEEEAGRRLRRWERFKGHPDWPNWDGLARPRECADILCFLAGARQIEVAKARIERTLQELAATRPLKCECQVLEFKAELPEEQKKLVTEETVGAKRVRKIVISTNLAETSLTLDGLGYVVDSGIINQKRFDGKDERETFDHVLHSRYGCQQRVGRVGRTAPGEAYRLYTRLELLAGNRPESTEPEIMRSAANGLLLRLASFGKPDGFVNGLLFQPEDAEVKRARTSLTSMGALDGDGDLTLIGTEMSKLKVGVPYLALPMTWGDRFGCLWEMALFASLASGGARPVRVAGRELMLHRLFNADIQDAGRPGDHDDPATWSDPYLAASRLEYHQELRRDCLDDFELYLKIWDGWFFQIDDAARRRWALAHAVSHGALLEVRTDLGLPGDPPRPGQPPAPPAKKKKDKKASLLLQQFWDRAKVLSERRHVLFDYLDRPRFLLGVGMWPDHVYSFVPPDYGIGVKNRQPKPKQYSISADSVWNGAHGTRTVQGHSTGLDRFAAIRKGNNLRDLVWLKWKWDPQPPSVASPLRAASELEPLKSLRLLTRTPFAETALIEHFPQPGDLTKRSRDVSTWFQGQHGRESYTGTVLGMEPRWFVQIDGGPAVWLAASKEAGIHVGARVNVRLGWRGTGKGRWVEAVVQVDAAAPAPAPPPRAIVREMPPRIAPAPPPQLRVNDYYNGRVQGAVLPIGGRLFFRILLDGEIDTRLVLIEPARKPQVQHGRRCTVKLVGWIPAKGGGSNAKFQLIDWEPHPGEGFSKRPGC